MFVQHKAAHGTAAKYINIVVTACVKRLVSLDARGLWILLV